MKYTIKYNPENDYYECNGYNENFIGCHLGWIGKKHKIKEVEDAVSESHMLAILQDHGLEIKLVEQDGSPLDY